MTSENPKGSWGLGGIYRRKPREASSICSLVLSVLPSYILVVFHIIDDFFFVFSNSYVTVFRYTEYTTRYEFHLN